jgi:hypothetical protein
MNLFVIQDSVCSCVLTFSQIKDLMDLRQKHANLSEARLARQQAEDTGKQGNTIMVFTIITVIFVSIILNHLTH